MRHLIPALALVAAMAAAPRAGAQDCEFFSNSPEQGYCSVSVTIDLDPFCMVQIWAYDYTHASTCYLKAKGYCNTYLACIAGMNQGTGSDIQTGVPGYLWLGLPCLCDYIGFTSDIRIWHEHRPYQYCVCNGSCYGPSWRLTMYCAD